jgi:ferritin-like metal-binding protein YciE
MAIADPADLFLYNLSAQYDAEVKGAALLGTIRSQARDSQIDQLIQHEEQESQAKIRDLDACFSQLNTTPADVPSDTVDGMRTEFNRFIAQDPPFEILQAYAAGAVQKLSHFCMASYRGLVDEAMQMGENGCAQLLQSNLVRTEESASRMERVKHDVTANVLAPV